VESRNLFNLYGLELQAQGGEHEDCGHEHCQSTAEPTGNAAGFGDFSMERQREPSPPARGSAAQCADMLGMHQRVTTSIRDSIHVGSGRLSGAAGPARSNSVQLPAIGTARSSSGPEPAAAAAEAAAALLARSDSCSSVAALPPSLGGGGHGGHGHGSHGDGGHSH
jgi:hypothetical protein